jgi:hypothetical protein
MKTPFPFKCGLFRLRLLTETYLEPALNQNPQEHANYGR